MKNKKSDKSFFLGLGLALVTLIVSACGGDGTTGVREGQNALTALCIALQDELMAIIPKDGIPALTDPTLVAWNDREANYLAPTDRVIGLDFSGEYVAVPHNILWWHEIVNFNNLGLAVTYCPFTATSMVFHRRGASGAEFGTSGFLFRNNLVMYDRSALGQEDTLWPQMSQGARCGPAEGKELTLFPSIDIEWEDWVALHPDTKVVSRQTGWARVYDNDLYPYGDYEILDNPLTLSPVFDPDTRRPPKERAMGIPFEGGGGIAFPFGSLRSLGDLAVVHENVGPSDDPVVVFWDTGADGGMVFRPSAGAQDLTFEVRDGAFVDVETESEWSLDGEALSGPLVGQKLAAVTQSYPVFWFAFTAHFDNVELWQP